MARRCRRQQFNLEQRVNTTYSVQVQSTPEYYDGVNTPSILRRIAWQITHMVELGSMQGALSCPFIWHLVLVNSILRTSYPRLLQRSDRELSAPAPKITPGRINPILVLCCASGYTLLGSVRRSFGCANSAYLRVDAWLCPPFILTRS